MIEVNKYTYIDVATLFLTLQDKGLSTAHCHFVSGVEIAFTAHAALPMLCFFHCYSMVAILQLQAAHNSCLIVNLLK